VSDRSSTAASFNTGTNAAPTPASGVRMTYGPDFTSGATGRGAVTLMGQHASVRHQLDTKASNARYRFDNGDWRIETGLGLSRSEGGYQDTKYGRFRTLGVAMRVPVRVVLADINNVRPQTIQVFDNTNQPVDFYDLNNYQLNTANSTPRYIRDDMTSAKLDVRKSLRMLPFPAALQLGGSQRLQTRDVRRESINWTYNGPDGNPATVDGPAPYGMTTYVNQKESFGFRDMPWISVYKVWEAYQANPNLWSKTPAQVVAEELFRVNNSERLQEGVSALYLQGELGLFSNQLKVVTGARYEKTTTEGEGVRFDPGAVWVRNPNGSFAHNAAGARIRKAEAGAIGSMDELRLTRQERGYFAKRSYDGYYPSIHLTYNVKENLLARAAYAKTYGRPDFTNIVPNSTIDEFDLDGDSIDPSQIRGRITIRNTGLRPWSADNYDLSLEYYTNHGGLFSGGVFFKEIKDFFGSSVRVATPENLQVLGLGPEYAGWELSTQFNLEGIARVRGAEFNIRHSLSPLGGWGRHFQVFANATKLELEGSREANFNAFIRQSANWGVTFSRKPLTAMAKWNHRGLQKGNPIAAVNGFQYAKPRTTVDVNIDYQIRSNLFFYINAQNLFNVTEVLMRYGPETPAYARQYQATTYGVQLTMGIKGTF
jgi:iron complex outermembrane recepter protein